MMFKFLKFIFLGLVLTLSCSANSVKQAEAYTSKGGKAISHLAIIVHLAPGSKAQVIGSGWTIKSQGQYKLVTAQHVALGAGPGFLGFCSSQGKDPECVWVNVATGIGPVISRNPKSDWIYWKVSRLPDGLKPVKARGKPVIGEPVCAVGNPFGRIGEYTCGAITNLEDSFFYMDARVLNGNSGGPVFDDRGRLLGMVLSVDMHPGTKDFIENSVYVLRVDQISL
jgi:S1-C subfamily serine protease